MFLWMFCGQILALQTWIRRLKNICGEIVGLEGYKDMKTRVRIITKEEFYKALDRTIDSNKGWIERNARVLENKDTINVVE
jgi:hypothetical protein